MFIDLTEEQESLRKELKSYFSDLMTPEIRAEVKSADFAENKPYKDCLLYTSPSPRDRQKSRMPSSA